MTLTAAFSPVFSIDAHVQPAHSAGPQDVDDAVVVDHELLEFPFEQPLSLEPRQHTLQHQRLEELERDRLFGLSLAGSAAADGVAAFGAVSSVAPLCGGGVGPHALHEVHPRLRHRRRLRKLEREIGLDPKREGANLAGNRRGTSR